MKRRAFLMAATLFSAPASAGLADLFSSKPKPHGEGVLNRVDAGTGIINITHGPVAFAGWQTMTRDLRLKPKTLAKGLRPGMQVRFRLHREDPLHYTVIAIEPRE